MNAEPVPIQTKNHDGTALALRRRDAPILLKLELRSSGASAQCPRDVICADGGRSLSKRHDQQRRKTSRLETAEVIELRGSKFQAERSLPPIKPLTGNQALYLNALRTEQQVIVLGPAGTGKTWIAGTYAADLYRRRQVDKIVLTRPNVPCGRSLGYFPGSMNDKFAPWAAPITEAISDRIGKAAYDIALKRGDIEFVPFEVMRGRSWKDAFVLLDEAQNATVHEMKTFLTRAGEDCTVVVNGDVSQSDLPDGSGLLSIVTLVQSLDLPVSIVEFTEADVVRSNQCAMWVDAFKRAGL